MKTNLALRADGSETIAYDYADHFVFTGRDKLSNYHNLSCGLHWHEELELIRILSGTMLLNVSGTVYRIKEGEGALINSNRFHSLFSKGQADCEFHCAILSPSLLCGSHRLEREFVLPFTAPCSPDFFPLDPKISWQGEALERIDAICSCHGTARPLLIQEHFFHLWVTLYQNAMKSGGDGPIGRDHKQTAMRRMADFIRKNYRDKLTLRDIAEAGYVSKNSCISLFRRYADDTPINYLIRYRLNVGAGLLKETSLSIAAISEMAGFSNPSYFTECFHKLAGCTPGEYRDGKGVCILPKLMI